MALMRPIDLISQCNLIYHINRRRRAHLRWCLKVRVGCNTPPVPLKCPATEMDLLRLGKKSLIDSYGKPTTMTKSLHTNNTVFYVGIGSIQPNNNVNFWISNV